jgi:signal peptidase I
MPVNAVERVSSWCWLVGIGVMVAVVTLRLGVLVVTVEGGSMEPTYCSGDRLLVLRRRGRRLRTNQIVIVRVPPELRHDHEEMLPLLVKRLVAMSGERLPPLVNARLGCVEESAVVPADRIVVLGDNPYSLDSKAWGPIPAAWVVGTATYRWPRSRSWSC